MSRLTATAGLTAGACHAACCRPCGRSIDQPASRRNSFNCVPAAANAVLGERTKAAEDGDVHLPGLGGAAMGRPDKVGAGTHGVTFVLEFVSSGQCPLFPLVNVLCGRCTGGLQRTAFQQRRPAGSQALLSETTVLPAWPCAVPHCSVPVCSTRALRHHIIGLQSAEPQLRLYVCSGACGSLRQAV